MPSDPSLSAAPGLCTRCGEPALMVGHDCRPWKYQHGVEVVNLDPHELLRKARTNA